MSTIAGGGGLTFEEVAELTPLPGVQAAADHRETGDGLHEAPEDRHWAGGAGTAMIGAVGRGGCAEAFVRAFAARLWGPGQAVGGKMTGLVFIQQEGLDQLGTAREIFCSVYTLHILIRRYGGGVRV